MASLINAYRISLVVEVSDTRCEWADRSIWHDLHVGIVEKSLKFELESLESFKDFLLVNMRLERSTVRETMQDARRFLEASNCVASYDAVKLYLESYVGKKPKTYDSQITSLRRFLRDFLKLPDAIMSFKMAAVDGWHFNENLPSKEQVRQGLYGYGVEERQKQSPLPVHSVNRTQEKRNSWTTQEPSEP